MSSIQQANQYHVKPPGESAGQPLNRVFERYTVGEDAVVDLAEKAFDQSPHDGGPCPGSRCTPRSEPRAGRFHLRPCGGVLQRYRPLGKFGEGDVEAVRGELLGEPVIDAAEYVSFAQVDRFGVVEVVG